VRPREHVMMTSSTLRVVCTNNVFLQCWRLSPIGKNKSETLPSPLLYRWRTSTNLRVDPFSYVRGCPTPHVYFAVICFTVLLRDFVPLVVFGNLRINAPLGRDWLGESFSQCGAKASTIDDLLWLLVGSKTPPLVILCMVNIRHKVWSWLCDRGHVRSLAAQTS
jgi:hypothetical protein